MDLANLEKMLEQLTADEVILIQEATVRKIESYPKSYGKTANNYYDLLFPDMVKSYLSGREINSRSAELLAERKAANDNEDKS